MYGGRWIDQEPNNVCSETIDYLVKVWRETETEAYRCNIGEIGLLTKRERHMHICLQMPDVLTCDMSHAVLGTLKIQTRKIYCAMWPGLWVTKSNKLDTNSYYTPDTFYHVHTFLILWVDIIFGSTFSSQPNLLRIFWWLIFDLQF